MNYRNTLLTISINMYCIISINFCVHNYIYITWLNLDYIVTSYIV